MSAKRVRISEAGSILLAHVNLTRIIRRTLGPRKFMAKVTTGGLTGAIGTQVLGKFSITDEAKTGLLRERLNAVVLVFCLVLTFSQVILIVVNWSKFPPQIPLFYSKPWGETMLASPSFVWLLPSLAFIFSLVNFIIAVFVHKVEKFIARVLVFASALVSFISFYAVLKIVTLLT